MEKIRIPTSMLILGIFLLISFDDLGATQDRNTDSSIQSNSTSQNDTDVDLRGGKATCYCGVPGTPEDANKKGKGKAYKIQGGKLARRNKYRWQVLVLNDGKVWCGGALINDRHIVTSAYWFKGRDITKFTVRLNEYDRNTAGDTTTVTSALSKITIHPNFNANTWDYDVAVLEMTDPVTLGSTTEPKINPICLTSFGNKYRFEDGDWATLTGWGAVNTASGTPPSQVLREVDLPILTNKVCKTHFPGLTDRMMCAGVPEGGKGPTNYDDGGPLQYKDVDGRYTLIGVTSWLAGKNAKGKESTFTRITEVREWIRGSPTNGAQWCQNDY